jgi:putative oxidoreductase
VTALSDENVGRLDVAVDDSLCVSGIQCIGNLDGQIEQNISLDGISSDSVLRKSANMDPRPPAKFLFPSYCSSSPSRSAKWKWSSHVYTFLRIIAGIIVFPYGMQKVFGWSGAPGFGAPGIKASLEQITATNIPKFIAWLIIIGQSFGSIALMSGLLGRIAAGGLFIIFTGALTVHLPDGWTLNWFGLKKGEGIEYFVLLLSLLLVIVIKGSGALSMDSWLTR